MDLSAFIVVIVMTLLSFGFIVWMAMYSGRTKPKGKISDISENNRKKTISSNMSISPTRGGV